MLLALMMFITAFQAHPHFTETKTAGQYIEIVKTEYDSVNNQTYAVLEKYEVTYDNANINWQFMQPRPFAGKPSNQDILRSIIHDSQVKVIGL